MTPGCNVDTLSFKCTGSSVNNLELGHPVFKFPAKFDFLSFAIKPCYKGACSSDRSLLFKTWGWGRGNVTLYYAGLELHADHTVSLRCPWSLPLCPFKSFLLTLRLCNGSALCKMKMAMPFRSFKARSYAKRMSGLSGRLVAADLPDKIHCTW